VTALFIYATLLLIALALLVYLAENPNRKILWCWKKRIKLVMRSVQKVEVIEFEFILFAASIYFILCSFFN
jgi:hypothetical protein